MAVIEQTPERLHLQFRDEPGSQVLLGVVLGVAALISLVVALAEPSLENSLFVAFTLAITAFAFLERTSFGCLADRAAGRLTIFQVNGLGLTHRISCKVSEIRAIEVRRRVSGRGRPCSARVILRSGRQLRLLSYKSCEDQRQIVNRLVVFLGI
jgi:hypothetical protein